MKFIHTADWHLGNSLHNINRSEESNLFLKWLKQTIIENKAQGLVIAGDVFDTVNPPIESRKQYFRFLASLLETECKNILVVGGNHDSASLLDAPSDLLDALNIQVVGGIWNRKPKELVREWKNAQGETSAIVCAIPYCRENDLREFCKGTEAAEICQTYQEMFKELYRQVFEVAKELRGDKKLPILMTGHLYANKLEGRDNSDKVEESELGNGMRNAGVRDIVGNLGTIPVGVFPEEAAYVALGHIHYSTRVAKEDHIRYSGSPFVMGFDEASVKHHVLLVDLERDCEVQKIETPQMFTFKRLTGKSQDIKKALQELNEKIDAEELTTETLKVEIVYDYEVGVKIRDVIQDELNKFKIDVVNWKINRGNHEGNFDITPVENAKEFSDEEIFEMLVCKELGSTMSEDDKIKTAQEYFTLFEEIANLVDSGKAINEEEIN